MARRMSTNMLGEVKDMGGVLVQERWIVKGQEPLCVRFHIGVQRDTIPSERRRHARSSTRVFMTPINEERLVGTMDLGADKKVVLSATTTDELGHTVTAPEGTTVEWEVDDETIVTINDFGDGSIEAVATGELGNAVVSTKVTLPNGREATGDLLISVVPGEAERVLITPGAVTEVTPDEPAPAPEPAPEG